MRFLPCTLYVPAGSLEAYKAAPVWEHFFNIKALSADPSSVEVLKSDAAAGGAVYTLDGRRAASPRSSLAKGIYIFGNKKRVIR